jgi:hypothetical protein
MTGVALFFVASTWTLTNRIAGVVVLTVVASLFKTFDAFLLHLPIRHGAVANPMFAFFMEAVGFLVMVAIIGGTFAQKKSGRATLGAASALMAVSLFPLVRFATGIPACVYPGTAVPLSIYFAPIAIAFSALTVPLGFWAGEKYRVVRESEANTGRRTLRRLVSPSTLVLCLAVIVLIRLV